MAPGAVDERGQGRRRLKRRASVSVLADVYVSVGSGLALALAVSQDPTEQVKRFVRAGPLGVRRLLVLGPAGGSARTLLQGRRGRRRGLGQCAQSAEAVQEVRAEAVHLFLAVPAAPR